MEKRYYVCINFGYEFTTASYIDLTVTYPLNKDNFYDVPKLNISERSTDETCKVKTAICYEYGLWKLATDCGWTDLIDNFTSKLEYMLSENKEHYKTFINLVFQAIIEHNSFLYFNEQRPDNRNFELCITCDGMDDVNNQDLVIEDYKRFLSETLPIPIKLVISKSDAVLFKFMCQEPEAKGIYSIDLGSGTTDYTYFLQEINNRKIFIIDLGGCAVDYIYFSKDTGEKRLAGSPYGSRHVERTILEWCAETQDTYKAAKKIIPMLLAQFGYKNLDCHLVLRNSNSEVRRR